MEFWQAVVVAVIPSAAALGTAFIGFRDLGMRRKLESSKQFLSLFATAHARPADGRNKIGLGEQIATIHLIADFAKKDRLLKNAAVEGLRYFSTWDTEADGYREISDAAKKALLQLEPSPNSK